MTIVKFCGIRTGESLDHAVHVGCDLVGLNFVPTSPRYIKPTQASALIAHTSNATLFVGVFKDPTFEQVQRAVNEVQIDFLQFSGDESSSFCTGFNRPYFKAFKVLDSFSFDEAREQHPHAWAYLLDSSSAMGGGSGITFDWSKFPVHARERIFLAGGLTPENVKEAISRTHPWGVDVASGIEADDHRKSKRRMTRFMLEARGV